MKRNLLISVLLLFSNLFALAQLEKGNCFFAGYGQLNFDIGKEKSKSGGTTSEDSKYFEMNFNPVAGYFIIQKLPVGIFVDSYFERYKQNDYKTSYTQYIVGPFVRYYIAEIDKLHPYAEGRIGIGQYISKYGENDSEKSTYSTVQLGAGASYFFAKHVALDAILGYKHNLWSYKSDGEGDAMNAPASTSKYIDNSFVFGIGIVFTFGESGSREKAIPCPEDQAK